MKIKEVIEFANEEFIYVNKKGKKLIYYNMEKNTFLEIYRKKGKLEKITLLEMTKEGKINKRIKLKFKSNGKVEVIVQRNQRENLLLNNQIYNDIYLNHISIYDENRILLEQRLTLNSNNGCSNKSLKKILTTKNQYFDNKKTKLKVNGENIELYERDSNYMIESLGIYLEKENICIEKAKTIIKEDNKEPEEETYTNHYIIPKNIYIYDRSYEFNRQCNNTISYISTVDGIWELNIKLNNTNKPVQSLCFSINKTKKVVTEYGGITLRKDIEKNVIIKIRSIDENLMRGAFTLNSNDNIKINGKTKSISRITGKADYDHEQRKLISNLDIRLKSDRLKLNSVSTLYDFECNDQIYHISSEEYSLFANLLTLSPYIIKNIESNILVKEKTNKND